MSTEKRINSELAAECEALKADRDALADRVNALAVENARCKFEVSRCHQTIDEMFKNRDKWIDKEWLAAIWSTSKRLMNETPATSAALAAIQAQGVEKAAAALDALSAQSASATTQGNFRAAAVYLRTTVLPAIGEAK